MDSGGEAFSSIDIVTQCLLDRKRVRAFQKAIEKSVKPGDAVLDVGTGSGILALLAARAGASEVIALEFDPHLAKLAKTAAKESGFGNVVKVVRSDARSYVFPRKKTFDVILMELLTTGMVDEFQIQAINNLHRRGLIGKKTKLIPEGQRTFVTAGWYDFDKYGFHMPGIYHLWRFMPKNARAFKARSNQVELSDVSFYNHTNERFSKTVTFSKRKSGDINSIYLESVTNLAPGVTIGDTYSINGPVVIPMRALTDAKKTFRRTIRYTFGGGYRTFTVS